MSPEIISERLYDITNSKIPRESTKNNFDKSDDVVESKTNGMYRIASNAKSELSQKAVKGNINFIFFLPSHFPLSEDEGLISCVRA
jgi:hypothetical protein